jgi:hypothetical protein
MLANRRMFRLEYIMPSIELVESLVTFIPSCQCLAGNGG